jgi:hypothetical protein
MRDEIDYLEEVFRTAAEARRQLSPSQLLVKDQDGLRRAEFKPKGDEFPLDCEA